MSLSFISDEEYCKLYCEISFLGSSILNVLLFWRVSFWDHVHFFALLLRSVLSKFRAPGGECWDFFLLPPAAVSFISVSLPDKQSVFPYWSKSSPEWQFLLLPLPAEQGTVSTASQEFISCNSPAELIYWEMCGSLNLSNVVFIHLEDMRRDS